MPKLSTNLAFKIVLLAVLYFVLGHFAFRFSVSYKTVTSAIFLPEGVALAFGLRFGKRVLPGVFLGQLALALSTSTPVGAALAISVGNVLEILLGIVVLSRLGIQGKIVTLRNYAAFVLVVTVLLQPFSAFSGVMSLAFFGVIGPENRTDALLYWWLGNSMGQLLMTPTLLAILESHRNTTWRDGIIAPSLVATLVGLVYLIVFIVFSDAVAMRSVNAFFFVFPAVIVVALRYELLGATLASLVIGVIAQVITVMGYGPFMSENLQDRLAGLNIFVVSIAVSAGLVGVLLKERRAAEAELRKALAKIKTLHGVLPICSYCKSIRDDHGSWSQLEQYVHEHSDAHFSHGICPKCVREHHPEYRSRHAPPVS